MLKYLPQKMISLVGAMFIFVPTVGMSEPLPSGDACAALIGRLAAATPNTLEAQQKAIADKRALELRIGQLTQGRNNISSASQVEKFIHYERILALLAQGGHIQILLIMRPYVYDVTDAFAKIENAISQMALLSKGGPMTASDRRAFAEHRQKFIEASRVFGENYGFFSAAMELITSVSERRGIGIPEGSRPLRSAALQETLAAADVPPITRHIINLTQPVAVDAAQKVLELLNPEVEQRWFAAEVTGHPEVPTLELITTMFQKNIYALIAKLQRDLKDQKAKQSVWRWTVNQIANVYLNIPVPNWVPERWRQLVLKIAGIAYDNLMLERHLSDIQEVVEMARAVTAQGNIMLVTDPERLEFQIKKILDLSAGSGGDDFLVTFSRVAWHTEVWVSLMGAVKRTAEATKADSSQYVFLYDRMQKAERRGQTLGPLPYLAKSNTANYIVFLAMQVAYTVGLEQGVQHWVWPYVSSIFGIGN